MSYFNTKKEFSLRDLLYRALIFIGTVGIIVYFLPRDGKFNYQFDIDKPWKYGQLMATFDFPIYKADEVVKREQDSILAAFQPYFQLDKSIEKSVLAKLKADYQTHLRGLLPSTDYVRFLERKLSEVYRAGIVSTEELNQLHKDSTTAIMVINDKLANQQDINKVYSVKDAYNYILTADTAHYRPDILRQCSLNEYLFPNLTYDEQRTETAKKEMLDNYSWANGIVLSGQKIIDRGEIVSQETYNILESLRKESIKRSESIGQKRLMLAGQVLFVSIFMLCFMLYLDLFRLLQAQGQPLPALRPHHVLLRGDGHHGCQQHIQCLHHSLCHAAYHNTRVPRLKNRFPHASRHHTDLLHLPALSARVHPAARHPCS